MKDREQVKDGRPSMTPLAPTATEGVFRRGGWAGLLEYGTRFLACSVDQAWAASTITLTTALGLEIIDR